MKIAVTKCDNWQRDTGKCQITTSTEDGMFAYRQNWVTVQIRDFAGNTESKDYCPACAKELGFAR